jgi:hypothetical protein
LTPSFSRSICQLDVRSDEWRPDPSGHVLETHIGGYSGELHIQLPRGLDGFQTVGRARWRTTGAALEAGAAMKRSIRSRPKAPPSAAREEAAGFQRPILPQIAAMLHDILILNRISKRFQYQNSNDIPPAAILP